MTLIAGRGYGSVFQDISATVGTDTRKVYSTACPADGEARVTVEQPVSATSGTDTRPVYAEADCEDGTSLTGVAVRAYFQDFELDIGGDKRRVYAFACCPGGSSSSSSSSGSGSGSGSGGGGSGGGGSGSGSSTILTPCCPGTPLPTTLYAKFTFVSSSPPVSDEHCMDGTYALTYAGPTVWLSANNIFPNCLGAGAGSFILFECSIVNGVETWSIGWNCSGTRDGGVVTSLTCSPFHAQLNPGMDFACTLGNVTLIVDITE